MDQTGGLALGGNSKRHDRSLAETIKAKGEVRSQFTHVIDVAPTVLEAAGLPEPVSVNGIRQDPIEGSSMVYSFNDAAATEAHNLQYFEMFGNRGIYLKGGRR